MKPAPPANWREERAVRDAGAVIKSAHLVQPEWGDILGVDEDLLWQGPSQPKLVLSRGFGKKIARALFFVLLGLVIAIFGSATSLYLGLLIMAIGILGAFPAELRHYRAQRRVFYSVSNKRAFKASTDWRGRRRLVFWPITAESSFRRISGDPPSVRFYEGRHESGRRSAYHAEFEAIPEATEVYHLLKRIQKDAA